MSDLRARQRRSRREVELYAWQRFRRARCSSGRAGRCLGARCGTAGRSPSCGPRWALNRTSLGMSNEERLVDQVSIGHMDRYASHRRISVSDFELSGSLKDSRHHLRNLAGYRQHTMLNSNSSLQHSCRRSLRTNDVCTSQVRHWISLKVRTLVLRRSGVTSALRHHQIKFTSNPIDLGFFVV